RGRDHRAAGRRRDRPGGGGRTARPRPSPRSYHRRAPCGPRVPEEDTMTRNELSDVVLVGCGLSSATPGYAPAPSAQSRRREVVVNGKRVKTVDVHAHCAVPEAMALVGRALEAPALLKDH